MSPTSPSLYEDGPAAAAAPAPEAEAAPARTAVVPLELFSSEPQPGQTLEITVVSVKPEGVEVSIESEAPESEESPEPAAAPDSGMAAMME